jgi:outer membrane protein assembly factor BamB
VEYSSYMEEMYVAKLDATTGQPLWSRMLQRDSWSSGMDVGMDVGMDAAGNVLLTGSFYSTLIIDGWVLTTGDGPPTTFLAKLDAGTGGTLWVRSNHQDVTVDLDTRVQVDGEGNALVVAWLPSVSFRLTKFDAQGEVLWSRVHGSWNGTGGFVDPQELRLALDASGNMLLSGRFDGSVNFGGGSYFSQTKATFLAWYGADGGYLTDRVYLPPRGTFGSPLGTLLGAGAAIDSAGNVVLGGSFQGTMDFGAGPQKVCNMSPFLLKIDPTP